MWLELSQFKTKFTRGNARKLAVNFTDLVTLLSQKLEKHARFRFYAPYQCQLARGHKTAGSLFSVFGPTHVTIPLAPVIPIKK